MSADEEADIPVREFLTQQLTELLPKDWRIIDHQRMPDTIDRTTVVIKLKRITKNTVAGMLSLINEAVILVACPLTDTGMAERQLDDDVLELCTALSFHPQIVWDDAEVVQANKTYAGWDISVKVLSNLIKKEV